MANLTPQDKRPPDTANVFAGEERVADVANHGPTRAAIRIWSPPAGVRCAPRCLLDHADGPSTWRTLVGVPVSRTAFSKGITGKNISGQNSHAPNKRCSRLAPVIA